MAAIPDKLGDRGPFVPQRARVKDNSGSTRDVLRWTRPGWGSRRPIPTSSTETPAQQVPQLPVSTRYESHLGRKQLEVFQLGDIDRLPVDEVARRVGLAVKTVRIYLAQARKFFREQAGQSS